MLFGLAIFPRWVVDDAYISYRYADNLVRHGELTWNIGEDPVEGYTGVFLPLVAAAAIKAGIEPESAGKALGVSCYFLTAFFMFGIARLRRLEPTAITVMAALYFTAPFLYIHALSGLETLAFIAALNAALYFLLRCFDPDASIVSDVALAFALLTASLVRPEGAGLAAVFAACLAAVRFHQGNRTMAVRWIGVFTAAYVLPGLLYFLWRWNYYGRFLPNTFYAKQFHGGLIHARSAESLIEFLRVYLTGPLAGDRTYIYRYAFRRQCFSIK